MGWAAELRVLPADGPERRLTLKAKTVIGREPDLDLVLDDPQLSRRHASIELRTKGGMLADLGSRNGTFLNGERVLGERPLSSGDVITLGGVTLVFEERLLRTVSPATTTSVPAMMGTRSTIAVDQLVRDDRVLRALSRVTSALVDYVPLTELYGQILDLVLELIPAERGAILLLEGEPPVVTLKVARGRSGTPIERVSGTIARRALDERMALLLQDVHDDPGLRDQPSVVLEAIRTAMCAPLWLGGQTHASRSVLGVVYLDSHMESPFGESDLHVLTVLANFLATKIESARLTEENLEKRRMEHDMRLAAEIQTQLMPQTAPLVPGYQVAGISRPWYAVGGDYYDFAVEPERLYFALGDVSGKGMSAGMLMAALRATVRACWRQERLAAAVARVNRLFLENLPGDRFATGFIARLELSSGRLSYVNAGHNRPLLVRARGPVETLDVGGVILGAFPEAVWNEGATVLEPGDTVLVFSDGVSDCWPDAEAADRGLIELVRAHAALGPAALEAAIFEELGRRTGVQLVDDRTLLVVRRLPH